MTIRATDNLDLGALLNLAAGERQRRLTVIGLCTLNGERGRVAMVAVGARRTVFSFKPDGRTMKFGAAPMTGGERLALHRVLTLLDPRACLLGHGEFVNGVRIFGKDHPLSRRNSHTVVLERPIVSSAMAPGAAEGVLF